MSKKEKLSKKIIFAIISAVAAGAVLITAAAMQTGLAAAHSHLCWRPDYEMADISRILEKDEPDDGDYEILYRQTGLTKLGADRMLSRGEAGKKRILRIQTDYFAEYEIAERTSAPFLCTDYLEDAYVTAAYLEDGDIIITSSTHLSGYRMGHSGLVVDAAGNGVLQASSYGEKSYVGSVTDFTDRTNFMIFSPKVGAETKALVAEYARANLTGKPYGVGLFAGKDSITRTQCAHLVWYAYKKFGVDIDGNGGKLVTPKDISASPELELVQVFGFDPYKLWN